MVAMGVSVEHVDADGSLAGGARSGHGTPAGSADEPAGRAERGHSLAARHRRLLTDMVSRVVTVGVYGFAADRFSATGRPPATSTPRR